MKTPAKSHSDLHTVRDTVESIWIAIVLAFVLRAFFVEAFVIPTGSMAPRLMGEHWALQCPNCTYEYSYGYPGQARPDGRQPARNEAVQPPDAHCPNCGFAYPSKDYINAGDRVLVMKYLYDFTPPEPWDVVVFRNPQNNQENYIKRLIGLPGETIEIVHGDIFVKNSHWPLNDPDAATWHIRRKPLKAQNAMWQVIFDNDYRPLKSASDKQWSAGEDGKWDLSAFAGRRMAFKGQGAGNVVFNSSGQDFLPTYGYNSPRGEGTLIDPYQDIVTDLKLSAEFVPRSTDATVGMNLSSFENRFRASVKADGTFAISHSEKLEGDSWQEWVTSRLPQTLETGKGHVIEFVHVDFQVQLWIDSQCVFRSTDQQYSADYDALKKRMRQAVAEPPDRRPIPVPQVSIGGDGGEFDLWHVKLMRDVFYTGSKLQAPPDGPTGDYARELGLSSPKHAWGVMDYPIELNSDSFFVLGDNSPQSLDGRAWISAAPTLRLWKHPDLDHAKMTPEENQADALYQLGTVPQYNMIGKAFFVYWPCGLRAPGVEFLPVVPNVGKMRLIR